MSGSSRWLEIAVVARPHGVKGELKLALHQRGSEVLLARPRLRLVLPSGEVRPAALRAVRRVPDGMLATLDGVHDRDAADALRGARVEVARAALPALGDGEMYCADLPGCEVRLGARRVGEVVRVLSYPSCDALVVAGAGGEIEVPLTDAYVARIDGAARVVELTAMPEEESGAGSGSGTGSEAE